MVRKIYLLVLLLITTVALQAQLDYYPFSLGYVAGESEEVTESDGIKSVSFNGGMLHTQWGDFDGNSALVGMPYNLLYYESTFSDNLFASKGYFGDYIELRWDVERYADRISSFKIYRKILGSTDDYQEVANLASDVRKWKDEYSESAVMYQYKLKAEGIAPVESFMVNYIDGIGFRVPYGRISGRVTYKGGSAVEGVSVIAETDDNFSGSSIYLNGTDAYLAVSPDIDDKKFKLESSATFQMWVRPNGASAGSVLFRKGDQYRLTYSPGQLTFRAGTQDLTLNFTEKVDTFFHVSAMRTADTLKLIVSYDSKINYISKAAFSSTTSASTEELKIGYDGTSHYFKGWIDELRIWHRSFTEDKLLDDAGMYIDGTEDKLSAYYRMNEGVGEHFYDLSRKGFSFNENHGFMSSNVVWSTTVPYSRQLAVKGITNENGNYIISGIPYESDGSSYRFVPVFGIHKFDPTEQLLFLGPGATVHNKVNFTDVASFLVKGEVYYKNTYFPVEDVKIKIDGKQAFASDGTPISSNAKGKFTVDVPIGEHYLEFAKYGHGFENNGRFPANPDELFDFQGPYTFQNRVIDTTVIKVIGKTVGGPIQASKPKGLGKSTNNIGNATIVLTTQKEYDLEDATTAVTGEWDNIMNEDTIIKIKGKTEYNINDKIITLKPDPETGEFFAYLLPEKYVIKSITAGDYTYPDEFHKTVDLTSSYPYNTEVDSVKKFPPIITATGDTIWEYRLDSVRYQSNLDLIYREKPTLDVVNDKGEKAFWESEVEAKDGTTVKVVDDAGYPLTDFPIFKQRGKYKLKISVFEKYINADNGNAEDKVPVTDGKIEVKNAFAIDRSTKKFKVDKAGNVLYKFTGGLANTLGDYLNAMSITAFTGNGGSIQTQWQYKDEGSTPYSGPFKAYIIGGLPTGNNFVTTGPNKIDMILRDPPGSNSYSYYEEGETVTTTETTHLANGLHENIESTIMLGAKTSIVAGAFGAGIILETSASNNTTIGLESSQTWLSENTTVTTNTTTKRWQTSDDAEFVGSRGDVFIGHSTNIVYGKCIFIDLLKEGEGGEYVDTVGDYRIGKFVGVRVNPEFGTGFQYSLNHIKYYLIPNLEFLRNNFLKNSSYYTSFKPEDDELYGTNNATQDTTVNGDGSILVSGDSYKYLVPASWPADSLFKDTVRYYNQQIAGWINALERNEREKVQAIQVENVSFDAGVVYESSETHEETEIETSSFEWQLNPSLSNETGFDALGVGFNILLEGSQTNAGTETDGTETTSSVTFGYVLNDADEGDYYSVDIKAPKSHTGSVFKTRGGQSQCPYEDQEVTEYFQPGTILSEAVMKREVPDIACDIPTQINVPEDKAALFNVEIRNASETDDEAWYMITVDEATNPNGASVKLDGNSINNGRVIYLNGGQVLKKVITIQKTDPSVNTYENIGIILHSNCQFDPGNNWDDVADTVFLTAAFKPVCTQVELTSPGDLWTINTNTSPEDVLNVGIDDYNINHTGFERIIFQYKPASSSQWISDKFYYLNESDYNNSTEANKEWINGAANLSYPFDMHSLPDRNYQIRAISTCAGDVENIAQVLSGIKDVKRPMVFGTPQPGDGILSPGDDVMLPFDETIQAALLLGSNFSVRGVLNGSKLRHSSALYFDGIDDYAGVIAGVNLQDKSFAIEFWTKRDNLNAGVIFSQGDIELGFNASNQFYAKMGTNNHATTHLYDFTDKWIHFTVSFDYKTKKVNVYSAHDATPQQHNDIEFENVDFNMPYVGNGRMYIAKNTDATNFYKGYIHDFRIWEKTMGYARANAEMLVAHNGDEIGLGGMWPMSEARGKYAIDLSRAHNAQINGAMWKVFPTGFAEVFDGVSSNISIPTASNIVITDEMDFTTEFWFNAETGQTNTVMFSNGIGDGSDGPDAGEDIWNIGINDAGKLYAGNNNHIITVDDDDYRDKQWHHFALVLKRNGNTSIFVDGNMKNYKQSSNFGGLKGANMTIGAKRHYVSGATSNYFKGSIDEFRVWKLARTSKLLDMDMNSKLTGAEKGLVAYYPFDKYSSELVLEHSLLDCDVVDGSDTLSGRIATANSTTSSNADVPNVKDARPAQNLAFNWVVNNDKINIKIDEPAELIEKCVIEFTADRIEDMHENRMASPVTWTAYIKKNTVIWNETQINKEKELYKPMTFDVDVLNIGGVEQNYSITNLPSWLSVDVANGTLAPDSRQTVRFTVDESVNIGNYDLSVFLTSDFGYNEKLGINLKVFKKAPDWEVNTDDFQYSMSAIGQLKIDGIFSTNTGDKVAAFVNDQCRGVANLKYISEYDMFEVFLNIYSNIETGEDIKFKVWNASEGVVHENVDPQLTFVYNSIHGTPANPIVFETTNSYTRKILLANGWKWISFNLSNPDLNDVNKTFSSVSPAIGDQIKGQTSFVNYTGTTGWTGSLANDGGFKHDEMYMVKLSTKDTLQIHGSKVNPSETPIELFPGWTWIGFTPQSNVAVKNALANINPTANDLIKGQFGFAMYDPAMGWLGSLNYLKPGDGYMYHSNNTSSVSLIYPQSSIDKNNAPEIKPLFSLRNWSLNAQKYQFSMSMIGEVFNPTKNVSKSDIIGAFVGDECRGIAKPTMINNNILHFITIYSNNPDEVVTFRLIDTLTNEVAGIKEQVDFIPNSVIGSIGVPQPLNVQQIAFLDGVTSSKLTVYPNPTTDVIFVDLRSYENLTGFDVKLTDMTGKVLIANPFSGNKGEIDLSQFEPGVYLLKVNTGSGVVIEKIVLN